MTHTPYEVPPGAIVPDTSPSGRGAGALSINEYGFRLLLVALACMVAESAEDLRDALERQDETETAQLQARLGTLVHAWTGTGNKAWTARIADQLERYDRVTVAGGPLALLKGCGSHPDLVEIAAAIDGTDGAGIAVAA